MEQRMDNYSDTRRKLEEEIAELEKASEAKVPAKPALPSVKLEEKTYDPPSDKSLAEQAEIGLDDYKRQGEASIRDKSAAGERELVSARDAYETNMKRELDAAEEDYNAAAKRVDADVIKRGLARSSVAVNAKNELNGDLLERTAAVRESYGKRIAELDAQISDVGNKLQSALNDFNLAYAVKLNDALNSLKAERDKKIEETREYNNTVKAKQAALDEQKARAESDLYTAAINQNKKLAYVDGEEDALYESIFNRMDAFLGSLDTNRARLEINNHSFYREHLNDYYYYKLFDKYGRKLPGEIWLS